MEKLLEQIDKKRSIKKITLDTYGRNMRKMYKDMHEGKEFKNLSFLSDFNKVKKYLETLKASVRKTRIATILVFLRLNEDKNEKLIEKYSDYLNDEKSKYDSMIAENKKSKRQNDNWVSYKKLVKVQKKYQNEIADQRMNAKGKKVLSNRQKDLLNKFLVSSLYILHPPVRLGYAGMKVISDSEYKKLSDEELEDNSYLVVQGRNNKKFHFGKNTYKTGRKYGNDVKPVQKKLNSVLNIWLHYNPDSEYLLVGARGKPMSSNSLTKYIMKTFSPSGSDRISSDMIRHILISENSDIQKLKTLQKKAEKLADDMQHSTKEQQSTYYKDK